MRFAQSHNSGLRISEPLPLQRLLPLVDPDGELATTAVAAAKGRMEHMGCFQELEGLFGRTLA